MNLASCVFHLRKQKNNSLALPMTIGHCNTAVDKQIMKTLAGDSWHTRGLCLFLMCVAAVNLCTKSHYLLCVFCVPSARMKPESTVPSFGLSVLRQMGKVAVGPSWQLHPSRPSWVNLPA